jgi:uncharacterized protein with HEPN domain
MFEKTALLYICTILEAIEKVGIYSESFDNGNDLRDANDQMNFNAVCRLLLAIGEEVKKIEEPLRDLQPQINWKSIIGLRNRMAHDYRGIDQDIVFDIIQSELGPLKTALISLLPWFSLTQTESDQVFSSSYYKHITYVSQYVKIVD